MVPSALVRQSPEDCRRGGRRTLGLHGIVFDPVHEHRHAELRDLVVERNRDAVLDPRTQELGTIGGFNKRLGELPWAMDRPRGLGEFAARAPVASYSRVPRRRPARG